MSSTLRETTEPAGTSPTPPAREGSPVSAYPRPMEGAPRGRVLVVDDEAPLRRSIARILMSRGFEVDTAEDGAAALDLLKGRSIDVVLVDLMMPKMTGMEVLGRVKERYPEVSVIMMTAFGDIDTAVSAVRSGAYDFLAKPFPSSEAVAHAIEKAVEHRRLIDKNRKLEERLEQHENFGELIGSSSRMQEVYRLAIGVAPTSSTVLILGENGTGKELVAHAIHQHSTRAAYPLRVVNCGAIPENLVETELFGSVRGAFTGALDKPGLFELADKGTVFLDEIGDLPPMAQVKLLRALAQGEIKRVGAAEPKIVDVRVLAATNVDLKERIGSGRFREDLYYRLSVIPVHLPPLRQRKDDIPLLAYHFLQKYSRRAARDIRRISVEALRQLRDQPWPGNVRELENAIEFAVVMARGDIIMPQDLPFARAQAKENGGGEGDVVFEGDLAELSYADAKDRAGHAFDRAYVERVMKRTSNNVSEAARQAGMDRSNFRRLLKKVRSKDKDDVDGDD
jgi:DNA-binding NtrC family response regulator